MMERLQARKANNDNKTSVFQFINDSKYAISLLTHNFHDFSFLTTVSFGFSFVSAIRRSVCFDYSRHVLVSVQKYYWREFIDLIAESSIAD